MPDGVVHAWRCPLADSNGLRMGKIALFMFVFSASWRIGNTELRSQIPNRQRHGDLGT
jgi:hypothetical protein